jgi:hypothetical protein
MVVLKRCPECIAQLPMSDFGTSKIGKDGLNPMCKACAREYGRYKYVIKYGKSFVEHATGNNRIIRLHNTALIQHGLSNSPTSIYGFIPHSNHLYSVSFGPSSTLSTHDSMSLIGQSDETLSYEYAYDRRDPNVEAHLLTILKMHSIRLEHSESDMLDSKNSIYYIGIL